MCLITRAQHWRFICPSLGLELWLSDLRNNHHLTTLPPDLPTNLLPTIPEIKPISIVRPYHRTLHPQLVRVWGVLTCKYWLKGGRDGHGKNRLRNQKKLHQIYQPLTPRDKLSPKDFRFGITCFKASLWSPIYASTTIFGLTWTTPEIKTKGRRHWEEHGRD